MCGAFRYVPDHGPKGMAVGLILLVAGVLLLLLTTAALYWVSRLLLL
jgi:hypothetical protein